MGLNGALCVSMSWWRMIRSKYFITVDVSASDVNRLNKKDFCFLAVVTNCIQSELFSRCVEVTNLVGRRPDLT